MGHLINIAVVGLGIGRLHVDGAANCEGGRLYAVCDIREDRIERITSKYPDVLVYRDYDEMLKDKAIDLITIAVPSGMHADFAIKALRAGKHVLIEKPMDIQVDRILEIEKVRLETGLKVGGVFQNRRLPVMQPLKKAVEEGVF